MKNAPLSFLIYLLYIKKIITPEQLRIWPMCIRRFWLTISSGIKSQSTDLNSCDTLYIPTYYIDYDL